MKILSWNVERPKNNPVSPKNIFIIDWIGKIKPDIVFLTETNSAIRFEKYHCCQSAALPAIHDGQAYRDGENRVSVWSKFPIVKQLPTYDPYTAICCEIDTPLGHLVLYGSIIGSFGGRGAFFEKDLQFQKRDIEKWAPGNNLIYSGDFNISFSGFPYPSKNTIAEMNAFFDSNALVNLTGKNENSVLHIVVSQSMVSGRAINQQMIKMDRKISDHPAIVAEWLKPEV
ncbi:endonuclease/exonuclease/phosphatase family protein [Flavobacterium sp.]|uniref:endonuclease/exonuclease/phosphatase family protein n=1 Tax=Flavobacterium sp. TaxID=239 RepID=UPI0039E2C702